MLVRLVLVFFVSIMLSGCAATQSQQTLVSQLQLRVGDLERQLDVKEEEIKDMQYEIKDLSYQIDRIRPTKTTRRRSAIIDTKATESYDVKVTDKDERIIRVPVSARKIQSALKSAGYYQGKIDGKIGKKSKAAIVQFQKDHDLKADGIIGKKTWNELNDYLE